MGKELKDQLESEITESENKPAGIFTDSDICLIEPIAPGALSSCDDLRVKYLPASVPDKFKSHYPIQETEVRRMISENNLQYLYDFFTIDQLEAELAQIIGDRLQVGIRGIGCSLDGEINHDEVQIKDLKQILTDGTEKTVVNSELTRITSQIGRVSRRCKENISSVISLRS